MFLHRKVYQTNVIEPFTDEAYGAVISHVYTSNISQVSNLKSKLHQTMHKVYYNDQPIIFILENERKSSG